MPVTAPALTQRSLLLAKIETIFNTDPVPTPALDAFLVSEADLQVEPNVLERNFYRPSLSSLPIALGRKLVRLTFRHEVKSSGTVGTDPKIGVLMRACGFLKTTIANTATAVIRPALPGPNNVHAGVTFADTSVATQNFTRYRLRVVLGGASATAKVRVSGCPYDSDDNTILLSEEFSAFVYGSGVTPVTTAVVDESNPVLVTFTIGGIPANGAGELVVLVCGGVRVSYVLGGSETVTSVASALATQLTALAAGRWTCTPTAGAIAVTMIGTAAGVVLTTGVTAVVLGASGASVTPSWTTPPALVLNDYWDFDLWQPGLHYSPVSNNFDSCTIYLYYDGMLHRVTGCMGNVSFTCEAGNFATAQFTFTGQYTDPYDAPLPTTSVFEKSRPVQVELAQLTMGLAKRLKAQSFTIDMGITITPRDSVSDTDGYAGTQYTARAPTGGINPEAEKESSNPYWRQMKESTPLRFHARVGTKPGNIVRFQSQSVQYSGIRYADRNGNRVYDASLRFSQEQDIGDDEMIISFM